MVAYVVVDFTARGTKPNVRPVGFVRYIDALLMKPELGKDDVATETCMDNGFIAQGMDESPLEPPADHAWRSSIPENLNHAYVLFEFAAGLERNQVFDATWMSGVIRGRFPDVHTWVIRSESGACAT